MSEQDSMKDNALGPFSLAESGDNRWMLLLLSMQKSRKLAETTGFKLTYLTLGFKKKMVKYLHIWLGHIMLISMSRAVLLVKLSLFPSKTKCFSLTPFIS